MKLWAGILEYMTMFNGESGDNGDVRSEIQTLESNLGALVAKKLMSDDAVDTYPSPFIDDSGTRVICLTSGSYLFLLGGESFDLQYEGIYRYQLNWVDLASSPRQNGEIAFNPREEEHETKYIPETHEEGQADDPIYAANLRQVISALESAEYSARNTRLFTQNEVTQQEIELWRDLRTLLEKNPPIAILDYDKNSMKVAFAKYTTSLGDGSALDALERIEPLQQEAVALITDDLIARGLYPKSSTQKTFPTDETLPSDDEVLIINVQLGTSQYGMNYITVIIEGREGFSPFLETKGSLLVSPQMGTTKYAVTGKDTTQIGVQNLFQRLQTAQLLARTFRIVAGRTPWNPTVRRYAHLLGMDEEKIQPASGSEDTGDSNFLGVLIEGVLEEKND
jgi:hypothetical protein